MFSRKNTKTSYQLLLINNNPVQESSSEKHLGMILDGKLNFKKHVGTISTKVSNTLSLLIKLQKILLRQSLLIICKAFIRPHFHYGDVIIDQSYNASFHQKLESFQYSAALGKQEPFLVPPKKSFTMN